MSSADETLHVRPSWAQYRARTLTIGNVIGGAVAVALGLAVNSLRHGGFALSAIVAAAIAGVILAGALALYLRNSRVSVAGTVLTQRLWWGGTLRWPLTAVRRAVVIEIEDGGGWTPNAGGPILALLDEDGERLLRIGGIAWSLPELEGLLARLPHTAVTRHPESLRLKEAVARYPEVFPYRMRHPNVFGIALAVGILLAAVAFVVLLQYLVAP